MKTSGDHLGKSHGRHLSHIAFLGAFTAVVGLLAGPLGGLGLEERYGLGLLFKLRGPVPPPPNVMIVSLDKRMGGDPDLSEPPGRWPRAFLAGLIDHLSDNGAAAICFDVSFKHEGRNEEDLIFAQSIQDAGNVLLHEDFEMIRLRDRSGRITGLSARKFFPVIPVLRQNAAACAPFALPKTPRQVSRYWTFKPDLDGRPTMPVTLFYFLTGQDHGDFYRLLGKIDPDAVEKLVQTNAGQTPSDRIETQMRGVKTLFDTHPDGFQILLDDLENQPPDKADPQTGKVLKSLVKLYKGNSRYLNFYGPSGSFATLSCPEIMDRGIPPGTVVFIGLSELISTKQKDSFPTVFSRSDGVDLNGVEILATAFSNFWEDRHIHRLSMGRHQLFVLAWGILLGLICRVPSSRVSAMAVSGASGVWLAVSFFSFSRAGAWYPLVIPIAIQTPAAFFLSVLWKTRQIKKERARIRQVFGYYVPDHLVDQLVENVSDIRNNSQMVHGACMFTDAKHFTGLSETVSPMELGRLMNQYYGEISKPIARHGGILSKIVGDGMLVLWVALSPDQNLCKKACLAALDIISAVEQRHLRPDAPVLPTRIGIHSGQFFYGNIGSIDHYDYTPMGDAVNTASRLESLNKKLGTWVLVSGDVLSGVEGIVSRKLGDFVLAGKSAPLPVYELIGRTGESTAQEETLCDVFTEALGRFKQRNFDKAAHLFNECMAFRENDGPSVFYLGLCEAYKETAPDEEWDGRIKVGK